MKPTSLGWSKDKITTNYLKDILVLLAVVELGNTLFYKIVCFDELGKVLSDFTDRKGLKKAETE